jgi:glutathione S-transferase
VLWLLEEIGGGHELEVMAKEERKSDEHARRHPLRRVPVLETDGRFLFESAALLLQLADLHPDARLNFDLGTHERGLVYQWTLFAMTELEPPILELLRSRETDEARAGKAVEAFGAAARAVEDALADREFLVGDRLSVADVAIGSVLFFGRRMELTGGLPGVEAYLERLEARPARQRAVA